MKRVLAVLFWSVISAAFIGPGTVTSCAAAGAQHGTQLLWALTFATLATIVLQEAAARLTIGSGRNLARALAERYPGGGRGFTVRTLVVGAILVGCAAYQAGNLLGAAAGLELVWGASPKWLALGASALATGLLWLGAPGTVATVLSLTVAVMGGAFLVTAALVTQDWAPVLRGLVLPVVPADSGLLVLGLVGTTVVPYNLFLGSSLAQGQDLRLSRFGITIAVGLGGLISMGIVVVGTGVEGTFSYAAVAATLSERLAPWAGALFGWGLFAAGLSSAVTAPLAAALTARGLFGEGSQASPGWSPRGARYRAVWLAVMAVGLGFALSNVPRIPAILVAQALNGVLLPVAAVFLWLAVNDRSLLGADRLNGPFANLVAALVVGVASSLGAAGLVRAISGAVVACGGSAFSESLVLGLVTGLTALLAVPVGVAVYRRRAALA